MKPLILSARRVQAMIPRRSPEAHKGTNGHLLIVAGSRGMSGAAVLCTLGALRGGAGLVTAATPESERLPLRCQVPEALTLSLPGAEGKITRNVGRVLDRYARTRALSAVALGPGLSKSPAVHSLVLHLIRGWRLPIVLDADGINSIHPKDLNGHRFPLILTPHPGEWSRFLRIPPPRLKREGQAIAEKVARDFGVICVVKGHRTLVTDGRATYVNSTGNASMATGGMGDVLTGLIGALLAQGLRPLEAAAAGVYIHGLAGDLAAVADRGLLVRELASAIPRAYKKIGVRL